MSTMTLNAAIHAWQPKPLNRTGDLSGWLQRMKQACPDPALGQVVYLDQQHFDRSELRQVTQQVGYLCIGFMADGSPRWKRGSVREINADAQPSVDPHHRVGHDLMTAR